MRRVINSRRAAILAGGTALLVMVAAGLVLRGPAMPPLDLRLAELLYAQPGTDAARLALAGSAAPMLAVLAGLVIVSVQAARTDRSALQRLAPRLLAVLAACPLLLILQELIGRPGPALQPGPTYPSGHAIVIGTLVATTLLIVAQSPTLTGRIVLIVDSVAVIVVVGSRMVLAEHYLSDLVGGLVGVAGIALLLGGALGLIPAQRRPAR
jgi:undecaprenyl-diphosphatase